MRRKQMRTQYGGLEKWWDSAAAHSASSISSILPDLSSMAPPTPFTGDIKSAGIKWPGAAGQPQESNQCVSETSEGASGDHRDSSDALVESTAAVPLTTGSRQGLNRAAA